MSSRYIGLQRCPLGNVSEDHQTVAVKDPEVRGKEMVYCTLDPAVARQTESIVVSGGHQYFRVESATAQLFRKSLRGG